MKNFCIKVLLVLVSCGIITHPVDVKAAHIVTPAIASQNARRIREEQEKQELLDKLERMSSNEKEQLLEELERRTEPKREENTIGGQVNLTRGEKSAGFVLALLFIFAIGILPMFMF